jgi:hypothetical protein
VAGIESLNLFHTRPCVLGQVEDLDLAMRENDPHANRGVAQAIDAAIRICDSIMRQSCGRQQLIELALKDPCCCRSVCVVRQEDVVLAASFRIALSVITVFETPERFASAR